MTGGKGYEPSALGSGSTGETFEVAVIMNEVGVRRANDANHAFSGKCILCASVQNRREVQSAYGHNFASLPVPADDFLFDAGMSCGYYCAKTLQ